MRDSGSRDSRRRASSASRFAPPPRRVTRSGSATSWAWTSPVAAASRRRASRRGSAMPAGASRSPISRSASARSRHSTSARRRRLILGDQRVDDLVQRLARHHLVDLVERQVDAVVGDAALRKIIGADALGAVAGADLALALGGARGIARLRARAHRAARAAPSSPWPCSCAAIFVLLLHDECRSADA